MRQHAGAGWSARSPSIEHQAVLRLGWWQIQRWLVTCCNEGLGKTSSCVGDGTERWRGTIDVMRLSS
ncbi:hypothetical protein PsorP6_015586 [Peronosclerospora sorghi]|uniref:Uncharacterized protein n=1 Tax=Peronosclerospora sorghi TaxID=230839 RepID=A0ACC0WQZ8_9STRA|nr:hypothetical protein PsorP6_015586 [Peronosclerospora sorghi]